MKVIAETPEERYDVVIRREDGKVFAEVGGRSYELEASEPEPNVYLLKHESRIYEVYVTPGAASSAGTAKVRGREFEINILDPRKLRGAGGDDAHADGLVEIRTAMPGKIVRVIASAGTEVAKGDGVIVVEAMKMQNELKSPKNGVIREIRVEEGSTVSAGDVLATIE